MKKFTYFLTVLFALALSATSTGVMAKNGNNKADKLGVCHATSSDSNPYVFITVSANGAAAHLKHEGDSLGESLDDCFGEPPFPPETEATCLAYLLANNLLGFWDGTTGTCVIPE